MGGCVLGQWGGGARAVAGALGSIAGLCCLENEAQERGMFVMLCCS